MRFATSYSNKMTSDLIIMKQLRTKKHYFPFEFHRRFNKNVQPLLLDKSGPINKGKLNNNYFQIFPGICLANGETIKNFAYLKKIGVTHVLNTAEKHVQVTMSSTFYANLWIPKAQKETDNLTEFLRFWDLGV